MTEIKKPDLTLYANSLLSKWGFGDGDAISDYIWENLNDLAYKVNEHKLLLHLVKKYLLPKLNHKIEVIFIGTHHNPVRAEMIDGENYSNWYEDDEWNNKLKPDSVDISVEDVKKAILEISSQ
jgi:hypothetical protein